MLNQRRKNLLWVAFAMVFGATVMFGVMVFTIDTSVDLIVPSNANIGVTVFERDDVADGYVLVSPLSNTQAPRGKGLVYLVDKAGEVVHEWITPHPLTSYVELLPNGDLMYLGRRSDFDNDRMPGGGGGGVIARLGWEGDVLWEYEDDYIHHDFDLLPDGSVVVLRWTPLSEDVGARIQGGIPHTEHEGAVWGDEILRISPDGEATVMWRVEGHLSPDDHPLPVYLSRAEWTHANSLRYVPSNPIDGRPAYLVSFRSISLVLMADVESGDVIWKYGGPDVLHEQHDPSLLDNGNVLIFDNGQYRYDALPASKVIEVDPRTNEVVWEYAGEGLQGWRFFSPIVSGAQRLANGNTLITEGIPGRLFEVSPEGEIVWEYFHPFGGLDGDSRFPDNSLFKARHYSFDYVSRLSSEAEAGRRAR